MQLTAYMKKNILLLDGGMGTLLQRAGLVAGELPERWNLSHADVVRDIHRAYFDAGSAMVVTNTFGANLLKYEKAELDAVIRAAVENARLAASESSRKGEKYVALDIGPSGKLLRPFGTFGLEEAIALFSETVKCGVQYGVDAVFIETMGDCLETKAAVIAVKEACDLPIFVSNAYGADGKLMTGATPEAMVAMLEGLGVTAIGANCSLGPLQLAPIAKRYLDVAGNLPILLEPNAGMPREENGKTVFDVTPEEFAEAVVATVKEGVRIVGGCCGTTPAYIAALYEKLKDVTPPARQLPKRKTVVSSYTHALVIGKNPILIGERINPTGKKRFRQAVEEHDVSYLLREGLRQQDAGVHALDVNVGVPGIDEGALLSEWIPELQAVSDAVLQIDTADVRAMERAMRCYAGKPLVNSVNGKKESMEAVFPLIQKYGGVCVALTLDENGIPPTAEGRLSVAKKILATAKSFGIGKENLIFDPLAMAVSADASAAETTLRAVALIHKRLGCRTVLGVSNVSFGLPDRDAVNTVFFAEALRCGLSAAIMNPDSEGMMRTYFASRVLHGQDADCQDYVKYAAKRAGTATADSDKRTTKSLSLRDAVERGLSAEATKIAAQTDGVNPLDLLNAEVLPALDAVGRGFEEKRIFLPGLLMSAEAAKAAFGELKAKMPTRAEGKKRMPVVLATVRGDIHDIGKNIVKLLLETYGFEVIDLGRDVPPETVVEKAKCTGAPLVGLSALMTTTVPAMQETVRLLKEQLPCCRVVVGGAVLTREYAMRIGADFYAADAMDTVRCAEQIEKECEK